MVKGITRQVVVVRGPDQKLFEQAIFLVREDALSEGGVTEEALLKQAREACAAGEEKPCAWRQRIFWLSAGALPVGLVWLLTAIL